MAGAGAGVGFVDTAPNEAWVCDHKDCGLGVAGTGVAGTLVIGTGACWNDTVAPEYDRLMTGTGVADAITTELAGGALLATTGNFFEGVAKESAATAATEENIFDATGAVSKARPKRFMRCMTLGSGSSATVAEVAATIEGALTGVGIMVATSAGAF